jgi:acyl-CoA synthetase (AMP-forming)/AMP-acid ligase II
MTVLWDEIAAIARRDPSRPALRAGSASLTASRLADRVRARANELTREDGVLELDGADPLAFVADLLAARAAGRRALVRPPGTPEPLAALRRDAAARAAWPPVSTVFYSSGSVGASKAVPLSDESLAAAALGFAPWKEIRPGDRVAIGLSPAHVFALVRGVLNALLVGAEAAFFAPGRDPLRDAEALGADLALLPSGFVGPAARRGGRVALRAVLCGGGRVRDADADAVEQTRGVPVRLGYGLTESAGLGARQAIDKPRRAGSSGRVAPALELTIVRDGGAPAEAGEAGEIRLRGAAVFGGYLGGDPPRPFDGDGRLCTGDVGVVDAQGELRVRGRLAYSLAASGRVLCAEEVEAALEEHPGVVRAAAAPLERAFGALVVAREASPALLSEIRRHAERRLPAFARPRRLVAVREIPLAAGGKVDRQSAARMLAGAPPEP